MREQITMTKTRLSGAHAGQRLCCSHTKMSRFLTTPPKPTCIYKIHVNTEVFFICNHIALLYPTTSFQFQMKVAAKWELQLPDQTDVICFVVPLEIIS